MGTYRTFIGSKPDSLPAPKYIQGDVTVDGLAVLRADNSFLNPSQPSKTIPLIYSAVDMLARMVASEGFYDSITRVGDISSGVASRLDRIISDPCDGLFSFHSLVRLLIHQAYYSRNGAYWYLAPDQNGELAEVWPVVSNRLNPVQDRDNFITHFLYTPRNGAQFLIKRQHIFWLRFVDPDDLYSSYSPVHALIDLALASVGIEKAVKKNYLEGRGIPLSIVSLDPAISDVDFSTARRQIRSDWESDGSTVAVVRGGTMNVSKLGLTQADMQILESYDFAKEAIEVAILGTPLRAKTGDSVADTHEVIQARGVYPLQRLLVDEYNAQVTKFFFKGSKLETPDARKGNRSQTIQENATDSRWSTMRQMAQRTGGTLFSGDLEPLNDLPVSLANNAQFVMAYLGIRPVVGLNNQPDTTQDIGNLPGAELPERATNRESGIDVSEVDGSIVKIAAIEELKKWKKVYSRMNGKPWASKSFEFYHVPVDTYQLIEFAAMDNAMVSRELVDNLYNMMVEDVTAKFG